MASQKIRDDLPSINTTVFQRNYINNAPNTVTVQSGARIAIGSYILNSGQLETFSNNSVPKDMNFYLESSANIFKSLSCREFSHD